MTRNEDKGFAKLQGIWKLCSNYEQGQWMEHGKTKGYA